PLHIGPRLQLASSGAAEYLGRGCCRGPSQGAGGVGEVRENDVADLTGCPVLSTTQPSTEHQPHGDSAPGEKAQHVLAPAGRTEPLFGQGSQPDVVLDSGDAAELTLQRSRQVPTGPLG